MKAENLRELSRLYGNGDIDRESYRAGRRELIDAIVSGEHELIEFVLPEPETPTVFPVDRGDGDRTQEIEPGEAAGGSERDRASATTWTILGGTAVVLLAVLAWWLLTRPAADTPPMSLSSEENVTGTDILADFLARNVWLPASVNAFRAAWDEVDPLARERLRASPSMDRLNDGILRQINSENALIELGDGRDALEAQAMLLELARHVGLDNARLRRAREDWEAAVATATPDVGDTAGATAAGGESPVLRASPDAIRDDADATSGDDPAASTAERNPPADTTAEAAIDTSGTGGNARPQPKRSDATDAEKTRPTPKTAPVASTVAVPTAQAATTSPRVDSAAPKGERLASTAPDTAASAPRVRTSAAGAPTGNVSPASRSPRRTSCKASLAQTRRPYCVDLLASGQKGPALVVLPSGEFMMGGDAEHERPRHPVSITGEFAIGIFEVSAAELAAYCAATGKQCPPQPWDSPDFPAVNVSWDMARDYTLWLSTSTAAEYRLPSEAEWEYAARGGTTTVHPFGDELLPTHARYSFKHIESSPLAARDRSVNRNEFRLYHIVGNVREWVADTWHANHQGAPADGSARGGSGTQKVVRGGSYADGADALRSSARSPLAGQTADNMTGFRVLRVIDD